jgi:pimeloyl-ACP methyl ester carboxylesterase
MHPSGLHVVHHHVDAPGFAVVLVHGAPDRSKNFAHVVHRLTDLNVTVYDRRGYGRSLAAARRDDGTIAGGFDVHADDLIAILDGTPSVVVGQSAGGAIAMLAATKAPELFAALGVWEPPMVPYDWWGVHEAMDRTMGWAAYPDAAQLGEDFNRTILGDERWDGLRESTKELLRAEGAAFRADMAFQAEPFLELDQIKVPFLVGGGTEVPEHCRRRVSARHEQAAGVHELDCRLRNLRDPLRNQLCNPASCGSTVSKHIAVGDQHDPRRMRHELR